MKLFSDLHPVLREQLILQSNQELVRKVPMFRDVSPDCVTALISALNARVTVPKEIIYKKGDPGKCMFLISRGKYVVVCLRVLVPCVSSSCECVPRWCTDACVRRQVHAA